MTGTEIVLLVGAIAGGIAGLMTAISALMNARTNRHELEETRAKLDESLARISELEAHRITDRRDIILIGESLAQARSDNSIMAAAFNGLWTEFFNVTGHKPSTNLDDLKRLQTVEYITGKLQPLNPRD